MRTILAACLAGLLVASTAHSDAPLIYEGNIDLQGKPMDAGGAGQWDLAVKVGNTGRVRLYTFSGTNVFAATNYTVTFNAGPSRSDDGVIAVPCTTAATYIEFTFSSNNLAYPFENWYSAIKLVNGATVVSQPEGQLSCFGAPEVDGGTITFTYPINWALYSYLNASNGPAIGDGTTITMTVNTNGQLVFASTGVASNGVQSLTAQGGITNTGTASAPILSVLPGVTNGFGDITAVYTEGYATGGWQSGAGTVTVSHAMISTGVAPAIATAAIGSTNYTDAATNALQPQITANASGVATNRYSQYKIVRNNTGSIITKGQIVYLSGAVGQTPTVALARSDATATQYAIGLAVADIAINATGDIITLGLLSGVDTSAASDGDEVFLSSTVAGGWTNAEPPQTAYHVHIGQVSYSHAVNGKLEVRIRASVETNEVFGLESGFLRPAATNGAVIAATNLSAIAGNAAYLRVNGGNAMAADMNMGGNFVTNALGILAGDSSAPGAYLSTQAGIIGGVRWKFPAGIDMQNATITNMAAGVNSNDAANVGQVQALIAADVETDTNYVLSIGSVRPSVSNVPGQSFTVYSGGGEVPIDILETANELAVSLGAAATGARETKIGYATGGDDAVAIGDGARAGNQGFAIGTDADGWADGMAAGYQARAVELGSTFGYQGFSTNEGAAFGYLAQGHDTASALGAQSYAQGSHSVAVGAKARVSNVAGAVQLGRGTNTTADTLQFQSLTVIDAAGQVPFARVPYAITNLGVTINGVLLGNGTNITVTASGNVETNDPAYLLSVTNIVNDNTAAGKVARSGRIVTIGTNDVAGSGSGAGAFLVTNGPTGVAVSFSNLSATAGAHLIATSTEQGGTGTVHYVFTNIATTAQMTASAGNVITGIVLDVQGVATGIMQSARADPWTIMAYSSTLSAASAVTKIDGSGFITNAYPNDFIFSNASIYNLKAGVFRTSGMCTTVQNLPTAGSYAARVLTNGTAAYLGSLTLAGGPGTMASVLATRNLVLPAMTQIDLAQGSTSAVTNQAGTTFTFLQIEMIGP